MASFPQADLHAAAVNRPRRRSEAIAASVVFFSTVVLAVISFAPFRLPEAAYAMLVPGGYWAYTRSS